MNRPEVWCCAQLDEAAVPVPGGIPIYDMRTDFPWHYEPKMRWAEMLERVAAADPDILKTLDLEDYPAPYPGARSILHWETYMVRRLTHLPCILITRPQCKAHTHRDGMNKV